MPELVKRAIGSYPPLANGPLAKPDGMRGAAMAYLRKMSYPMAFGCLAFFGTSYVRNL